MKLPLETICDAQVFCRTCREPAESDWRRSLAVHYAVPPHAPEFACPHHRPWGYSPKPAPRPVAEPAAESGNRVALARAAVCRTCDRLSQAGICEVLWPNGCCAGRWYDFLKERTSVCPRDRWPVMEDRE